ncbi:MAG: arpA protein [Proteobacteria bacterium]|nr:arpA protein [Pseudomonadota bacterium]
MPKLPIDPASLIDTSHYPLGSPHDTRYQKSLTVTRTQLERDGCAVIPDFLSPLGLSWLLTEAEERRKSAYFSAITKTNVYFSADDASLAEDHPQRIFLERTNGFITSDCYDDSSASRVLYNWQALINFIQDCLGKDQLYIYEDPVSDMIVNVLKPGSQFNWHFDTNEFTITMLLKSAVSGGHFEYVPNLRNANDECYDEVRAVLSGDTQRVACLPLSPGDLQLFLGRFSLHRVTKNTGLSDRLLLIMSFAEKPGIIGSVERNRELYGKVTEKHLEAQTQRVRADGLMD